MRRNHLLVFLALLYSFAGCTVERAEEQILARHANGVKKTSIWVYPDGTILKRNEWYNDGIKEFEIPYQDGVPHGEFKRWTGFGDIELIGSYKKGLKDGKWTNYFVDKLNTHKKQTERFYKDDIPTGDWTGWHYNGEKAYEEHYNESGIETGIWKKWHDNGVLAEENNCHQEYENDNTPGYIKRYGRNCKILEFYECYGGKKEGTYKLYYESYGAPDSTGENCNKAQIKEEGTYLADEIILSPTYYRADGTLIKKIESNEMDGITKIQWFDEQNNIVRESKFTPQGGDGPTESSGISYGTCTNSSTLFCAETSFVRSSLPSGTLDSSTLSFKDVYKKNIGKHPASLRYIKAGHVLLYEELWQLDKNDNGKSHLMESRSYYPDSTGGKMASEGFWQNDVRHGIWRNWYKSGILKDSLTYVNGERIGDQFSYDSTGKLTIHRTEHGKNRPVIMHLLDNRGETKDERLKNAGH